MNISDLSIGNVYTNNEIMDAFGCAFMGGMRRSKKTNTLVLVFDHTKSLYDDCWDGNVLHYTGMGKTGDQVLKGNQNKSLQKEINHEYSLEGFMLKLKLQYFGHLMQNLTRP